MPKKTTEMFIKEVYDLVGDEYTVLGEYTGTNNKIKMKHEKCSHEYYVSPNGFLNAGNRCPLHKSERISKRKNKTTEMFIKEVYDLVGDEYTVLGEYINSSKLVLLRHNICNKEFKKRPNDFLSKGSRCPDCTKKLIKRKKTKTTEMFIKEVYDLVGDEYTVLGEYISSQDKIEMRHNTSDSHNFFITPTNFLKRKRCNICNKNPKNKGSNGFKEDFYRIFNSNDYTIKSRYINNKTPIVIEHSCGYSWEVRPVDILHGNSRGKKVKRDCPRCQLKKHNSKDEIELYDYIKQILPNSTNVILSDRKILEGLELDIYIPSKKIAIEYNGLYWHGESQGKDRNYHLNKLKKCNEKGIRLIHLFENEWIDNKELIKGKIKHILGLNNGEKIYARKCYIEEIQNNVKRDFLDKNHIQGSDNSTIKLGLWYPRNEGDELVAVMTFCKPRVSLGQKGNKYDYELSRFATERDYNVIGSFGKLFSYFKKNYDWNKIITYADLRWSEGNVYHKNSFHFMHNSQPNYWYFNKNKLSLSHRYNYRKQRLKELFPEIYSNDKTEIQIMREAGYDRIWDCGNLVFEYTKKKIKDRDI
ncbi:HNH endonuclease [Bacillus phage PBS1]|uniref:HNH endonuclease n=1 Tax=Bacillus phage PBS1 TaxID=2884423 RepID=A0A223LC24_BPPB1|nr:homing endonuclease [Bacillus phage PBS1]AST99899.1 HNH endonuclease [Bacillus phage PBS1]BDE75281.1 hypothetical protein [Bacillus phage PBS1]